MSIRARSLIFFAMLAFATRGVSAQAHVSFSASANQQVRTSDAFFSGRAQASNSSQLRYWPHPSPPAFLPAGEDENAAGNDAAANRLLVTPEERTTANFDFERHGLFLLEQRQSPLSEPKPQKAPGNSPTATTGSPGHIFWVVPAFKVDYAGKFQPLTPKEKFQEWAQGAYDPLGLAAGAFEAGVLERSSTDGFCGYGKDYIGYLECFGSGEVDSNVSSFIGDYLLTVAWHQDPRYFRLGRGPFARRLFYAISRVFVTFNDQGHTVFYSSALSGTAIAAGISNLYYPPQDRGFGLTLSRIGLDLGNTALYNAAAEFWPDIKGGLDRVF